MNLTETIRPFTDAEYSVMVLLGLQRMLRKNDYWKPWIVAKSIYQDNANAREVTEALDFAIAALRFQQKAQDDQALLVQSETAS